MRPAAHLIGDQTTSPAGENPRHVALVEPVALAVITAPSADLLAIDTPWRHVLEVYLHAALNSAHTIAAYRHDCTVACERMGIRSLTDLTGPLLAAYRGDLVAHGELSPATQARRLYALRSFLSWSAVLDAHRLNLQIINAALKPPKSTVRTPYKVLKSDDAERLWQVAAERPVTYALLCICMGSGLRISEIAHLRVRDCFADLEGGPALHVLQGKGGKDRTVPMRPEFFEGIVAYLESTGRTLNSPGRVFLASDRRTGATATGISSVGLNKMLRKVVEAAGIDSYRFNVHALRHSYAIGVLRHSHDVVAVQKLLGHASVTTTSRYVDHLDLADLRDALPGAGPAAQPAPAISGLTTAQAAAILGVTTNHVGYLCDKGTLVNTRATRGTSRNRLITPESVEALRAERADRDSRKAAGIAAEGKAREAAQRPLRERRAREAAMLADGRSIRAIARETGRDPHTIRDDLAVLLGERLRQPS